MTDKKDRVTFVVEVDREVWERFKSKIARPRTLKQAVADLIEEESK